MKFAAFVLEEGKKVGKEQALQLKVPFDELAVIEGNQVFLFENMPTIKSVKVMLNVDVLFDVIFPFLFSVVEQPLELKSDYTLISRPRNYFSLGFVVNNSRAFLQQIIFDYRFCLFYSLSFGNSNKHDTLVKAL